MCVCPFKHSFDFVLKIDSIERECTCVYPTCTMYTSHVYHIDRLLCALHMLSFSHFVCDAMGHAKINKSMNNSQGFYISMLCMEPHFKQESNKKRVIDRMRKSMRALSERASEQTNVRMQE